MPDLVTLSALFSIGFLGSAHCFGMCGGFAVLAKARGGFLAYAVGKTSTYVFLGAVVGGLGSFALEAAGAQRALSVGVGLLLVMLGAAAARLIADRFGALPILNRWLGPLLGQATKSASRWGTLGVGLVNGFLPCGLVFAAMMKSSQGGSMLAGAISMGVFGLGTLPALWAVGLVADRLPGSMRDAFLRLGGWLVIALGIVTIWRGLRAGAHH